MSRGVCMTRAPVVRVRGGWGGTHLRYLAVKSAVRYWAITILPLDSSLTLMEWVGEVFKSLSIGGWQIWEGVPPPQLLLVCYEQLPRTIQGEGAPYSLASCITANSHGHAPLFWVGMYSCPPVDRLFIHMLYT